MRLIHWLCALLLVCTACSAPQPSACTDGFTCTTLRVPLDHQRADGPSLDLAVIAANNVDAPRGVLLMLAGGPGQPGVSLLPRIRRTSSC